MQRPPGIQPPPAPRVSIDTGTTGTPRPSDSELPLIPPLSRGSSGTGDGSSVVPPALPSPSNRTSAPPLADALFTASSDVAIPNPSNVNASGTTPAPHHPSPGNPNTNPNRVRRASVDYSKVKAAVGEVEERLKDLAFVCRLAGWQCNAGKALHSFAPLVCFSPLFGRAVCAAPASFYSRAFRFLNIRFVGEYFVDQCVFQ